MVRIQNSKKLMEDEVAESKLEITISCLQSALNDAQGTIRAYDQKANVMGLLLTIALGVTNFTLLQSVAGLSKFFLVTSWVMGLAAMFFLGAVLFPLWNPAREIKKGTYAPTQTYFVGRHIGDHARTVSEMAADALETDWVGELAFENTKLAFIRGYKHLMYKWATYCSAGTVLSIGLAVIAFLLGSNK